MTILLKTLIFGHLEVLDYHPNPASSCLWCYALPYALGDLWYRLRQRVRGDEVDLQFLWANHHPRDFLAAFVGRGLDEAPAPHGVNAWGCEGRRRRDPRELDSVCQNKPSSPANRPLLDPLLFLGFLLAALLLDLPLPLLLGFLLREEDVRDRYVHFGYVKAHQALYPVGHIAPDGLGELRYGLSVLGRQRQVERGLLLTNLYRDPLGLATAAAARDAAKDAADGLRATAAHPDAVDLLGRDPGDLRDYAVRDAGRAPLGL